MATNATESKLGAYVCSGCGIGDRLDVAQLSNIAKREGKAQIVQEHALLCSKEGVKLIQDDIDNEGVNKVAIIGCSRRVKTEAFSFENVAISRGNLREGVIWVRPDNDEAQETTQEMADDYVRMACTELKYMTLPASSAEQGLTKHIGVVGGGITGMTAAIEASKAGYKADIIERSGALGGHAAQLYKRVPRRNGLQGAVDTGIADMVAAIDADDNITVHLNSTVAKTAGAPGRFEIEVAEGDASKTITVGAIVQATGFTPYDINKLDYLGGGKNANVVDQLGLEKMMQEAGDGPLKTADGKEITSVAFVQCAGQRSSKEGELSYCSGHCCTTSIKQAMYLRERNGAETTVLFDDLRVPGSTGEDFYRHGQENGVTFRKGKVSEVSDANQVNFKDLILDEDTSIDADLVVLATGMVANSGPDPYMLLDLAEAKREDKQDVVAELQPLVDLMPGSILNLDYRQGTDLPVLRDGFNDSHFICFPYETRRTGIYAAGPLRRPMDMAQAEEDATGAALKAVQACENAAIGRAAHPRSGDLSFPSFRKEGCTQCKRCTVECPFGAINEDEEGYPQYNEARCRRCGTCMGACPVRVISFENYSVETVGQQLKIVDMPDEFDEKPRILALACENDAYPALDMAGMNRIEYSAFVRVVPVRCLGSVNTIWVTDALNSGYDGVMLFGCQKGENYQCHFVKGSEMAHYRMSKVDDTLQSLSLEKERVQTYEVAITDIERIPQLINEMEKTIGEIGMSPFKF